MATADKSKRLPKELQDFKRELKKLTFKEKVKAYFDCAPYIRNIDSRKKVVITRSFSKDERGEFSRRYLPIHNAIERYGDRIRAINSNRIIYTNYLDTTFRQRNTYRYTADLLNLVLPKVAGALEESKEDGTREKLTEALRILKSYRRESINSPEIKLNKEETSYEVPTEEEDKALKGVIQTLRGLLSLLKCYLEALKEFLEWVGTPELYPKEFDDIETSLLSRYRNTYVGNITNPDAKEFPLHCANYDIEEEYLSIDYKELPLTIDISRENNPFANVYRSFFNY